jgi:hypothetical protein
MTSQDHIEAIGKAQLELEARFDAMTEAAQALTKATTRAERQLRRVHYLQDRAQRAFKEAYPEDNVVLFSGGNDKPPVDDPDEPVKP